LYKIQRIIWPVDAYVAGIGVVIHYLKVRRKLFQKSGAIRDAAGEETPSRQSIVVELTCMQRFLISS